METLEYETVWSGALEAAGLVPGLSACVQPSQLVTGAIVYAEDPNDAPDARRVPFADRTFWDRARDGEAVALLERGLSLAVVAKKLGTSKWCIRRVALRHALALGPAGWATPRSYRGEAA